MKSAHTQMKTRGNDMDRNIVNRTGGPDFGPKLALLATAAIASLTLTATATSAAPRAEVSYSKAQKALDKGKITKAISYAEAAVLAEPRNASYRALLGTAYLEAGRYNSAAESFGDALELGDTDSRTVLSYALTKTAIGEKKVALETLLEWERALDPADAGLAMALAGNPERGVFVLTNALRAGQNTPKIRQNLAYTYALAGNWRAARVMAAEDVPANQLDVRLSDWASKARPEGHMMRVSALLGIAPVSDGGVPTSLALSNFPSAEAMLAEAEAAKPMEEVSTKVAAAPAKPSEAETLAFERGDEAKPVAKPEEKAPVQVAEVKVAEAKVPAPVTTPAPKPRASAKTVQPATPTFVSRPVTQDLPEPSASKRVAAAPKKPAAKPATKKPAAKTAAAPKGDSHMVQLGSYNSEVEAKRGWTSLKGKFPQLAKHDVVITKAEVKGKTYYRVAAAGFGRQGAAQMCSTVKSAGRGCFAYSKNNPPAGAVDKGTRIAAATR